MEKIIRTICCFTDDPGPHTVEKANAIAERFIAKSFAVQTKRICSPLAINTLEKKTNDPSIFLSVGSLSLEEATRQIPHFFQSGNVSFNLDLTSVALELKHVELLFKIIHTAPKKTFNMAYVFHHAHSSPYFPSAQYAKNGYAIGLQPTNLSDGCGTLEEWLERMRTSPRYSAP